MAEPKEKRPCRCPDCQVFSGVLISQERDSPQSVRRRLRCHICGLAWDQIDFRPEWHLIHVRPEDWPNF